MELAEFQRLYANRKREFRWIDLRGQDLTGMHLANTVFLESNLDSAILVGVNLQNARLPKANLQNANLSGADLSYAKLKSANLRYANFSGANLTGADFSSADLTAANMNGAILVKANFTNAILTDIDWGTADRSEAVFSTETNQIAIAVEEIIAEAQIAPSNALPEFQEKWHYKPEDLLTAEQKLALSPALWLAFVFVCYLYQGFASFSFLKQGFSWLFAVLSFTSPLLWLMSPTIYWGYPALLFGIILFTSFDIFSFFFSAIAFMLSFQGAMRYRSILDKQKLTSFTQMSPNFQRKVTRDALALGSSAVIFITIFRSLFVQPAVAVFLLSSVMSAMSGAIATSLLRNHKKASLPIRLTVLLFTSWLGGLIGLLAVNLNR